MPWLSQVTLDDVFRSTQESMQQEPTSERVIALLVGVVAMIVLLVILQQRRRHLAASAPLNHHGRLLKEMFKTLSLNRAEIRQLRKLADQQSCASPLTLLMCPSLLTKALHGTPSEERKVLAQVLKRLGRP